MSDSTDIRIERTIQAPLQTVWNMWTKSELFQKWYGPDGASIPVAEMDVQVGGKRRIAMQMETPNGSMTMWFAGEYTEINPPSRLVYTEFMADEQGNPLPADMTPRSNEPTTVIVELEEVDGATKMTVTHVGVPAGSPGEAGWKMAVEKLVQSIG